MQLYQIILKIMYPSTKYKSLFLYLTFKYGVLLTSSVTSGRPLYLLNVVDNVARNLSLI